MSYKTGIGSEYFKADDNKKNNSYDLEKYYGTMSEDDFKSFYDREIMNNIYEGLKRQIGAH